MVRMSQQSRDPSGIDVGRDPVHGHAKKNMQSECCQQQRETSSRGPNELFLTGRLSPIHTFPVRPVGSRLQQAHKWRLIDGNGFLLSQCVGRSLDMGRKRWIHCAKKTSCCWTVTAHNDNDNDNDTLREVPHRSNEGLALQARVSGPWPPQKRICLTGEACHHFRIARVLNHSFSDGNRQNQIQFQTVSVVLHVTTLHGRTT